MVSINFKCVETLLVNFLRIYLKLFIGRNVLERWVWKRNLRRVIVDQLCAVSEGVFTVWYLDKVVINKC